MLAIRLCRGTRLVPDLGTPSVRAFSSLLPASWPARSAVVFLLTDPDDLGAEPLQRRLRLVAGHRFEGAGDDAGLAGQRPGRPVSRPAASVRSTPGRAEALDQVLVGRRVEPGRAPTRATTGPTSRTRLELLDRGGADRRPSSRRPAASAAAPRSPTWRMPSAKTTRDSPAWRLLSISRDHVGRRLLAHPLERGQLLGGQRVDVGGVLDQARRHRLIDQRLAEPLDVHRAARGEVLEAAAQPRRTARVLAAPDRFLFASCSGVSQIGQVVGITHGCGSSAPVGRRCGSDITTFGMTSPAFSIRTIVAGADVLARDFLRVVQRRPRDRRAGQEHRLEHGVRRHRAGAADVDADLEQLRRRLLRRELVGEGPARKLRRRAGLLAPRDVVQLDDDAVGLERQVVPRVDPLAAERDHRVDAVAAPPVRLDRQRPARERLERRRCAPAGRASRRARRRRRADRRTRRGRAPRPASDRACASCRRRRCGRWRTAAPRPPRARG